MSILIDKDTKVLVQGITGNEGSRATKLMLEYGTKVVAGVTPGKGGQQVEDIPVYNSIKEALQEHEIDATAVYVPSFAAKDAIFEALNNDIKLINVITEGMPIHDTAKVIELARQKNARVIGPSSVGIISPSYCKIGMIGGLTDYTNKIYSKGNIGIVSKSGGMTNETAWIVARAGFGQSTVIGIGGDILIAQDYIDILELFENDEQTKAVVIFGELGGIYEDKIADMLKSKRFTKPIIAFIAGRFTEKLPQGIKFGHAGALIEGDRGMPSSKIKKLKDAGALIAEQHDEIPTLLKQVV